MIDTFKHDSTLWDKLTILLGYSCKLPYEKKLNISPIRNLIVC